MPSTSKASPSRTPRQPHRTGVAAVLAMIYLVLFSTLAIGFYAATNVSARVSHNEFAAGRALLAAETGIDFMRHHLANVVIHPATPANQVFQSAADQLADALDGTGNLRGGRIAVTNDEIRIPANPASFVSLDPAGNDGFQAIIRRDGEHLDVSIIGRDLNGPSSGRGIRMSFALAENASNIFDFGLAARGTISANGNVRIRGAQNPAQGSILSAASAANPVTLTGNPTISGDISITNAAGAVSITGVPSVGGTTDPTLIFRDHVHVGVAEPEFPTVDTDPFAAYATNAYSHANRNNLVNVRIPANTNPTINGNVTIRGVLFIEAPNNVRITGNADIQGVIVTENNPVGNLMSNSIDFAGNVVSRGVETLPASFGDLRNLTGSFLLAPNFHTSFTGNFGTVNGSIIAGRVSMTGNAGGTVMGTVVNLLPAPFTLSGNSAITISSTGTSQYPSGVKFSSHYAPLRGTYEEFIP